MDSQNSQLNISGIGLISGVSLSLGLLFNYFFYGSMPGLAFPIYIFVVTISFFVVAKYFKISINKEVFWLLIPTYFFSVMVFIRDNTLLTLLNIIASLLLLLLITEVFFRSRIKNFLIGNYLKIFLLPFEIIGKFFQTLPLFSSLREKIKGQKNLLQIIKGILKTIPILFIFSLLFSSADLVFKKYFFDLININIGPETISRMVVILMVASFHVGIYSYFSQEKNKNSLQQNGKKYVMGNLENSILLGSVNILFFIFIFVQITYFFGGESNISTQGFTYAQYARRGFFELIAVAVISLFLLLSTEKFVVKKDTGHFLWFKILSTILVFQVIIIMQSAFIRMYLYEEAYGFTTLRLYSHTFIILLAVIFCSLIYKIYANKKDNFFASHVFISVILFLVAMNLLNPDAFIARRNIERFIVTGKIDVSYLQSLSGDAVPDTIELLTILNDDNEKGRLLGQLRINTQDYESSFFSKWQSLNLSRMRADKIVQYK